MAKFVGNRTRSKEGPRHVTGRGLYTDDFTLPGMLQAMILRSPHAHAKINSIDPSEALKNPNVMAVITPEDVKQLTKPFKPGRYAAGLKRPVDEYAGAVEKVRYVGEPIGAVAARDRGTAEDALELIQVDYEPLRAVVDVREAIKPSSATLFDELGTNLAWQGSLQYGDIEAAFKSADRVVKETLKIHRYSSTPLEPFVVIASYDAASKRLTVWVTAQVPEVIYDGLREALGLQDVRVIIPDVGGGFGQKIHLIRKYVVLVSLLAMKTGRPVKWIEDRSEHMMAGGHACAQEFEAEAAVKNDGTVLGLHFREYDDVGGSISTLTIHFTNKLNNLSNTYRTPSIHMEGYAVVTNKCPVIPNRGIGKPGMCYIWERMMDRVAQALELSPIEVRRKNLIQPSEMPYRTISGNVYDSGDYPGLLSTLLEKIEYDKLRDEQKKAREQGKLVGIGIVIGVEPGGRNAARDMAIFPEMKEPPGSGGINGATIKLEKNGTLTLHLGSPNCGHGGDNQRTDLVADTDDVTLQDLPPRARRLAWRLVLAPCRRPPRPAWAQCVCADPDRARRALAPDECQDITLATHIADVVNVIRWEQLSDVVLVGHSYAGYRDLGRSGAGAVGSSLDRVPRRIRAGQRRPARRPHLAGDARGDGSDGEAR